MDPSVSEQPLQIKYDNFYTPQNSEFYSRYNYKSLRTEEHTIRLLRIQPLDTEEDERSQIKCELIDDQLLAAIQDHFTAISYCAGDPKKTETIAVNGLEFRVFANLGHALRQVRHFWREKRDAQAILLWVDQICINQSSPDERSSQVSFMGDIYGSARQALVCLSVEGSRSGGIQWLQQFSREFQEYKQNQLRSEGNDDSSSDMDLGHDFLFEHAAEESFHSGWDTFLATILSSPWWPRAWIRQEFLLSNVAYFLAANESVHWKPASEAISTYYHASYGFNAFGEDYIFPCPQSSRRQSEYCPVNIHATEFGYFEGIGKCASNLLAKKMDANSSISMPLSSDLVDNLEDVYLCEASDPRDLIYSCFGLSSHSYGIDPDYSSKLSFQDLLVLVAQSVLVTAGLVFIFLLSYDVVTLKFLTVQSPGMREATISGKWQGLTNLDICEAGSLKEVRSSQDNPIEDLFTFPAQRSIPAGDDPLDSK